MLKDSTSWAACGNSIPIGCHAAAHLRATAEPTRLPAALHSKVSLFAVDAT
jgi:hypothetical protein